VYAHPDDESWSCAGLFSYYGLRGLESRLLTATYGEAGFQPEIVERTPEHQRKATREAELGEAARIVGLAGFEIIGFPDGVLESCLAALEQAVAERMLRYRPRIVITFDETGVTGHRDHIAVHAATTAAFAKVAPPGSRLLYNILPERVNAVVTAAVGSESPGNPVERFVIKKWNGPPPQKDGSAGAFCVPDDRIAVVLDVRAFVDAKRDAILAHRSQVAGSSFLSQLPKGVLEAFLGWEYFQLGAGPAYPKLPARDVFEGMDLD